MAESYVLLLSVREQSLKLVYYTKSGVKIKVQRELAATFGTKCWFWEIRKDFLEILNCRPIKSISSMSLAERKESLRFKRGLKHVPGHDLVLEFVEELAFLYSNGSNGTPQGRFRRNLKTVPGNNLLLKFIEGLRSLYSKISFNGSNGRIIGQKKYPVSAISESEEIPFFGMDFTDRMFVQSLSCKCKYGNDNLNLECTEEAEAVVAIPQKQKNVAV